MSDGGSGMCARARTLAVVVVVEGGWVMLWNRWACEECFRVVNTVALWMPGLIVWDTQGPSETGLHASYCCCMFYWMMFATN